MTKNTSGQRTRHLLGRCTPAVLEGDPAPLNQPPIAAVEDLHYGRAKVGPNCRVLLSAESVSLWERDGVGK